MPRLTEVQQGALIDAFGTIAAGWTGNEDHDALDAAATELRKAIPPGARLEAIGAKPAAACVSAGRKVYHLSLDRKGKPQLMYQP